MHSTSTERREGSLKAYLSYTTNPADGQFYVLPFSNKSGVLFPARGGMEGLTAPGGIHVKYILTQLLL